MCNSGTSVVGRCQILAVRINAFPVSYVHPISRAQQGVLLQRPYQMRPLPPFDLIYDISSFVCVRLAPLCPPPSCASQVPLTVGPMREQDATAPLVRPNGDGHPLGWRSNGQYRFKSFSSLLEIDSTCTYCGSTATGLGANRMETLCDAAAQLAKIQCISEEEHAARQPEPYRDRVGLSDCGPR